MDEFMSTIEAAERLGITYERVTQLVKAGKLNAKKFGRDWMVSRQSVEERLEKSKGKSKHDPTRGKN
jgi:excisionase family DNA binding protein